MTNLANEKSVMSRLVLAIVVVAAIIPGAGAGAAVPVPPAVGKEARDFKLIQLGGSEVKLSRFTKEGPVVLVVLRGYPGYQCPLCTIQFGELQQSASEFAKLDATVLLVYPGPSDSLAARAAEFVHGKDYPAHFRLLLDPDYKFTNAYGLRWDAENETSYPSTFVIDRKRRVVFAKVSTTHGDRARVEDVLKALAAL